MRSVFLLLFAIALECPAQVVSFGVKAGVPATESPFQFLTSASKSRWTVGPSIEVRLTHHLSVELDALYRGADIEALSGAGSPDALSVFLAQGTTRAWDFPVLLKYRIVDGPARPFVSAGMTGMHESADLKNYCSGPLCQPATSEITFPWKSLVNTNRIGATVGAGLEFRAGRIKISPELRWTRFYHPNANLAELLVGFNF